MKELQKGAESSAVQSTVPKDPSLDKGGTPDDQVLWPLQEHTSYTQIIKNNNKKIKTYTNFTDIISELVS